MGILENFHNKLNTSIDIDKKYQDWSLYREQVTDIILKGISNSSNLLILGAGSCNDIDLTRLKEMYHQITLSDIDILSVQAGIIYQNLNLNDFLYKQVDYSHMADIGFFDELSQKLMRHNPVNTIIKYMKDSFEVIDASFDAYRVNIVSVGQTIKPNATKILEPSTSIIPPRYDAIVILPLYTQLILPPFKAILSNQGVVNYYSSDEISHLTNTFLEYSTVVIEGFNHYVKSIMTEETRLILLADILEYQAKDPEFTQLNTENTINTNQGFLEQLVLSNIDHYGHGFGSYGVWHMDKLLESVSKEWLTWPYEIHRKMIVLCKKYEL